MKISPTLMKKWMTCPLQVKFDAESPKDGLRNAKTSFGTCVHDALDKYNKYGDIEYAIKQFEYTWANPDVLNAVPEVWSKGSTYGQLRQLGLELLKTYHEKNKWNPSEIIASEHRFCVPIGEHFISGIVDVIEVKGRKLRIVDYKTSYKKPNMYALGLDVQFTAYVYASLQPEFWMGFDDYYVGLPDGEKWYNATKHLERRAIWYHFQENKEINAGPRDDNDFGRLYRCIIEIANAIDKDVYVPNISGDSCVWCPYTDICPVVVPVLDKVYNPPQQELF